MLPKLPPLPTDELSLAPADGRIISITCGSFQATLYPTVGRGDGRLAVAIDLYHAGTAFTHPRFVCTGEEAAVLAKLAAAAESLVRDYLNQGKSYAEWCAAAGLNPFDPEIGG
jgi:hypothetical protein